MHVQPADEPTTPAEMTTAKFFPFVPFRQAIKIIRALRHPSIRALRTF
jgi:hypothetical protein